MKIRFSKLDQDAVTPSQMKDGDVGFDLTAISMEFKNDVLEGEYYQYRFGIAVEIPKGYFGLLLPRSSTSKKDLVLANSVGCIDENFRGEITARYKKVTKSPRVFRVGDRLVQLVILPYPKIEMEEVTYGELTKTNRGNGAYGSSGV